jgi:Domain of unknown function (DUF4253)
MQLPLDAQGLTALLTAQGVVGELEPIQITEHGPLYRLAVAPVPLVSSWQTLRNLVEHTGFWPLAIAYSEPIPAYQVAIYATDHYHYDGLPELEAFRSSPRPLAEAVQEVLQFDAERDPLGPLPDDQWFTNTIAAEHTGLVKVVPQDEQDAIVNPWTYYDPANLQREQPALQMSTAFLLVPTTVSWHVPLVLRYGATDSCPPPEIHAHVLRYWSMHYGAEPVVMTSYIELHAQHPPHDQPSALCLAWQQQQYCWALMASGEPLDSLAARLFHGEPWVFLWDDE